MGMEIDFPGLEKGASVLSEKKLASAFIVTAVLVTLLGPLGISSIGAESTFRALPMDSLEMEAAWFERRVERSEPLSHEEGFRLLTMARSYLAFGLFDVSERWFLRLGQGDVDGFYEEPVFNGLLSCALGRGDWERAEELLSVDSSRIVELDENSVLRLIRHMVDEERHGAALGMINGICLDHRERATSNLVLYKGLLLRSMDRLVDASFHYEALLNAMKMPGSLHPSVVAVEHEIRQGAADCAFLLNDRLRARRHYRSLSTCVHTEQRNWARFQLAQLDMLDNGYEEAAEVFASLGPDSIPEPMSAWAVYLCEHASTMKIHAEMLPDNRPKVEMDEEN